MQRHTQRVLMSGIGQRDTHTPPHHGCHSSLDQRRLGQYAVHVNAGVKASCDWPHQMSYALGLAAVLIVF